MFNKTSVILDFVLSITVQKSSLSQIATASHIFNFSVFVHYCRLANQSLKYYLVDEINKLNPILDFFWFQVDKTLSIQEFEGDVGVKFTNRCHPPRTIAVSSSKIEAWN